MRRFLAAISLSLLVLCLVPSPAHASPLGARADSPWSLLTAWFEGLTQVFADSGPIWDPDGVPASERNAGDDPRLVTPSERGSRVDPTSVSGGLASRTSELGPIWDPDGVPAGISSKGDSGPIWDPDGAF